MKFRITCPFSDDEAYIDTEAKSVSGNCGAAPATLVALDLGPEHFGYSHPDLLKADCDHLGEFFFSAEFQRGSDLYGLRYGIVEVHIDAGQPDQSYGIKLDELSALVDCTGTALFAPQPEKFIEALVEEANGRGPGMAPIPYQPGDAPPSKRHVLARLQDDRDGADFGLAWVLPDSSDEQNPTAGSG